MKLNLKQVSDLVSKAPELLRQGQQLVEAAQNLMRQASNGRDSAIAKNEDPSGQSISTADSKAKRQAMDSDGIEFETIVSSLYVPADVVTTICEMVKQANETMRFCEEQKTVRTEIRAKTEIQIERINAMADCVRDYLKRSFDERAGVFDQYFNALDKALENGDNTLAAQTLQSINTLAASSPFKDLADLTAVQQQLGQAGSEWDI